MAGHRPLREAGGPAGVEDRGQLAAARVVHGERWPVGQRIAGAQHGVGAGVGEHVLDLGRGEPGVHRHRDRARQLDAEEREHPVDARGQQDRHAVTPRDAARGEPARDPGRAVPQLPVGQPLPADLDERLTVGVRVDGGAEQRDQ